MVPNVSCGSGDRLYIVTPSGLYVTSVFGYTGRTTALWSPVGDFTELPEPLKKFLDYGLEGWEDSKSYRLVDGYYQNEVVD